MHPMTTTHPLNKSPPADRGGGRRWLGLLLFFAAITIPCAWFYSVAFPALSIPLLGCQVLDTKPPLTPMPLAAEPSSSTINDNQSQPAAGLDRFIELQESEDVRLERVLKAAAMPDNTVIVTTSNAPWSAPGSIIDVFLETFKAGNGTAELLKHLVIVALDPTAYLRCKSVHSHCFFLDTKGLDLSEEPKFMSKQYLQLVWEKLDVLRKILAKGHNFVFTDADVMWFRNPFPHFDPDVDFQSSCDAFTGDPTSLKNSPNTGFKYVKASNRTVSFYDFWYESRLRFPGDGQQGVLREIKFDPYIKEIGLTFRFLDWDYFGGLCRPAKDLGKVVTMHTTCCVGIRNKVHDMKVMLRDWNKYTSLPLRKREVRQYTWSQLQLECS